jgi:hypothetical protein
MSTLFTNNIFSAFASSIYTLIFKIRLLTFWTVPQAAKSAPAFSAKSRSQPLQFVIDVAAMASSRS